jgi:hypothetical protein
VRVAHRGGVLGLGSVLFTCSRGAFLELGLETVTLRGGRFSRKVLTEASGSCIGIGHVGAPGRGEGEGEGEGGRCVHQTTAAKNRTIS